MWFVFLSLLLVALEGTPTTFSANAHVRRQRETSSTSDGFVLNSTDVIDVQLNSGATSLEFEVCHKPQCKGMFMMWFSAKGKASDPSDNKEGFCRIKQQFAPGHLFHFNKCLGGEISNTKFTFLDGLTNTPNSCGINISDDRRLKVQLESLVEGCEVRVKNGKIWTETANNSNVKIGLAIGIPIGIIIVIGVVTLLVIFVGRPWWKKRKTKKNRANPAAASKDAKRPSATILPVSASACALTPAAPQASSVPPVSSVPPAPSVPAASSIPPTSSVPAASSAPPASSAAVTPAAPQTPSAPPAASVPVPQTPAAVAPSSAVPSSEPPAALNEAPKATPKKPTPVKVPRLQKDIMPSSDDLSPSDDNDPAKAPKASKETQQSVDGDRRPGPTHSKDTAAGSRRRSTDAREPSGLPQPEPVPPTRVRGNMEPGVYRQPPIPRAVDRDGNPRSEAVVAFEEYEVQ